MNFLKLDTLEKYFENKPETLLFPLIADTYLKIDQVQKAEQICRTGLTSFPNESYGYFVLANILLKKGNLLEAVKQLQNAIKNNPGHIKAHQLLLLIGKENLSLSEIDASHKVVQNFEKHIYPTPQITNPYFNDELSVQLEKSKKSVDESFIDETEYIKEKPFLDAEHFIDEDKFQGFDLDIQEDKEDELDLSAFEFDDKIQTVEDESDELSLDIKKPLEQANFDTSEFPEINFETNFEEQIGEEEIVENNLFIPSILEDKIADEIPILDNHPEPTITHDLEEFSLDLDLEEFTNPTKTITPDNDDISFIPDHSIDNEVGELDLDFSFSDEFENQKEEKTEETNDFTLKNPDTVSSLSIKPVSDSFDTSLLNEIENHQDHSTKPIEEEHLREDIPEFKNNIKKNLDDNIKNDDKNKINLNIPIPTLTFVEVLQNQKLYDQALEILDLLEKRSSDKGKIIRKKEEIIKLKSLEN